MLHQHMTHVVELRRLALALAIQPSPRFVRGHVCVCVSLERCWPWKSMCGLRPGGGGSSVPSRRRMLLTADQASISVPSKLKCSDYSSRSRRARRPIRRSSLRAAPASISRSRFLVKLE